MANFVSYSDASTLMAAIGAKFAELNGAYVIKGNSAFADLPATPTAAQTGFVYNVTDEFTTDSRFVEGAGKVYPAGTNVAIINLGDATTANMKYDVIGAFVDVAAIEAAIQEVADTIGAAFDEAETYAAGDYVVYEGSIYKFNASHTGTWSDSDVDEIGTVIDLVLSTSGSADARVDTVVADLAPAFSTATAYAEGDVVTYQDGLYKFTAAHAAGAWSSSDTTAITVADLEPDSLTAAQITALEALLG
ncbi:MAG: hypothetical protein J6Y02_02105 [Pseudobutyrivibrio sp.]|nr:hypothetical protein [Pseudobutyrivibrio sp.]